LITKSQAKAIKLGTGDIVLLPTSASHIICDTPDSECGPEKQDIAAYQIGNDIFSNKDRKYNIVCGYVEFDSALSHPFINNLPEFIHIRAENLPRFHWLDSIIKQIIFESEGQKAGSNVLLDRFTEILFIQVIRSYAEMTVNEESYLSALMDKQLSNALSLIHENSAKNWTIEMLATDIGMSRSAFYSRFNDYIGMPPMQYIFEWRMLQAKQKIENTQKSLVVIAEEVGYSSVSAFQKAFKRYFCLTPASLRKDKK